MPKSLEAVAAYQAGLKRLEDDARGTLADELATVNLADPGVGQAVVELMLALCESYGNTASAIGEAWAVACMPDRYARADLTSMDPPVGLSDKARRQVTDRARSILTGAQSSKLTPGQAAVELEDVLGNHLATINRDATLRTTRTLAKATGPADVDLTTTSAKNQLITFLEAAFDPGDYVALATKAVKRSGHWSPTYRDSQRTAAELIEDVKADGIARALRPNRQAGAWVTVNPVTQGGTGKADVTAYRHTLIECDTGDKADQLRILRNSGLPISALVDSGNKSIHAWVRVDAENEEQFRQRRAAVVQRCQKLGLEVDTKTSSPANLARLPGVERNGQLQELIDVDLGPESWDAWAEENGVRPDQPTTRTGVRPKRRTTSHKGPKRVAYVRVPRPDCRCAFCLMMGSRGAYSIGVTGSYGATMTNESYGYRSAKSAGGTGFVNSLGDQGYHADCRCVVVPLESAADVLEGYEAYTESWYAEYRAAYEYVNGEVVNPDIDAEYARRSAGLEYDDAYHRTLLAMRLANPTLH